MKKLLVTAIVSALLMLPTNVLAVTNVSSLSFDKLEDEIDEYNPAVKIYDRQLEIVEETFDIQKDAMEDQISAAQAELAAQIAQYDAQITDYTGFIENYTNLQTASGDPSVDAFCQAQIDLYTGAKNAAVAAKALLQAGADDEADWEDDLDDDLKLAKQTARYSANLGRDTQVYLAQKNYLGYAALSPKLEEAKAQLDLLTKQQDIMKLKLNLGLATQANADEFEVNIENAKIGVATLERTMNDLKGSLNLALGQDYDNDLTLAPLPEPDWEKIHNLDYGQDLRDAKDNSYKLKLLNVDYDSKDNEYDRADTSSEEDKADLERDNLKVQINDMERKIEFAFDQAYKDLLAKEDAYEVASGNYQLNTTNWNFTKIKYDLGMISSLDYSDAENKYEVVQHQYQSAQQDVLEAYTDYQWAVEGLIPSLNS
ncbi:MAG TPA: TolC family protein [Desulfitobacteriaceae bacterium]|nr:TolC family protein [Desulfitobacteriaceae bacterium]